MQGLRVGVGFWQIRSAPRRLIGCVYRKPEDVEQVETSGRNIEQIRSIICHYANEYGDRESKKAGSSLRARSNSSAFIWANRERRSGGARQRERRGEKHGNIYAFRQGLFNDGLSQRPICT
jgi:hypothetical protein